MGKIEKTVVNIQKGKEFGKINLMSSKEAGIATLSANAKDLESTSITIIFMEKMHYCMYCGAKLPLAGKICPTCNRIVDYWNACNK